MSPSTSNPTAARPNARSAPRAAGRSAARSAAASRTKSIRSGLQFRPPRLVVRRDGPLGGYESALARGGFGLVAGADEAGRGACAGPLVVAACILPPGPRGRIDGLDDSKVLTAATRERLYAKIVRKALAYQVVIVPAAEIDAWGLHVANLAGMRRALGTLVPAADYALTDGFAVPGLGVPSTAVWKGDATVGCIAAASILAKVTRDAIMTEMHDEWPDYEFAAHKGYITPAHAAALTARGPCPEHRRRYVNVRRALGLVGASAPVDDVTVALGLSETDRDDGTVLPEFDADPEVDLAVGAELETELDIELETELDTVGDSA